MFLLLAGAGCRQELAGPSPATAVAAPAWPANFHWLDADRQLCRSGQPAAAEFRALADAGVRSVLNLRHHHSDRELIAGTGLQLYELPLDAGSLTADDLIAAVAILRQAPKPVLIHCWHGSDRTGAVVAAWRMIEMRWDPERAITEMESDAYGFHRRLYRRLPRLLRSAEFAQPSNHPPARKETAP